MHTHPLGMHHLHLRKRIHEKGEEFPSDDKYKRFMDRAIYVVAIAGPLFYIPQVLRIWVGQSAAGVSAASFTGAFIISAFWIVYGTMHKEKPILYANILYALLQAAVVIGALIY